MFHLQFLNNQGTTVGTPGGKQFILQKSGVPGSQPQIVTLVKTSKGLTPVSPTAESINFSNQGNFIGLSHVLLCLMPCQDVQRRREVELACFFLMFWLLIIEQNISTQLRSDWKFVMTIFISYANNRYLRLELFEYLNLYL